MSRIGRMLVWCGGYWSSTVAKDSAEDLEPIAKLGGAVLFATLIGMTNWGMAGWVLSAGLDAPVRVGVSLLCAAFGAVTVLTLDRSFLYSADSKDVSWLGLVLFTLIRVIFIVLVSSSTSQAVIPLLFEKELKTQGLQMTEASEKKRFLWLNEQIGIQAKESAVQSATDELERLAKLAATLPIPIQQRLSAADACWKEYVNQKTSLQNAGYTKNEIREKLSGKATVCDRSKKLALEERSVYLTRVQALQFQATKNKLDAETTLAEATSTVKSKMERAGQIESESFTPLSSVVLWELLSENPGARAKWVMVTSLFLLLELLPFVLKLQAGRSNVGRRIIANRRLREAETIRQIYQTEHDLAVFSAVNDVSLKAVYEAMENPEVRAIFAQTFAANIAAFAPTEAVKTMMRDLESRHVDVEVFMSRYPRYATIIAHAWSNAVGHTTEILRRGLGAQSFNEAGAPA